MTVTNDVYIMKILRKILLLLLLVAGTVSTWAQTDRQFIRNGNRLYRQQNYAKAEVEYRKALGKNPHNAQALYNLGCALMMQQKDSAAITQLENAGKAETAPRRKAMVYHNIGTICQNHQMYAQAIEAYKESLRNNPADNETRYNLALCQRLLKKQKKNGGGNNNKNKNDKNKNKDKQDKQNQQQKKQQDKQDKQQQQQPKEQMSKENAEQLLNAAMQEEKATQQRLKKQEQQPRQRRLQKQW
jgi:tetratricopeptide (TPR) repeat protein